MKYSKFFISFFSFFFFWGCLNQVTQNKVRSSEYKGIITNIYKDLWNHEANTFSVDLGTGGIEINADSYPYCWQYASLGDSIIKPKDELYIIIKKKSGDERKFYYR